MQGQKQWIIRSRPDCGAGRHRKAIQRRSIGDWNGLRQANFFS
jgi:hypothetical protein